MSLRFGKLRSSALALTACGIVAVACGLARSQELASISLPEYDGEFHFARLAYRSPFGRSRASPSTTSSIR